MKKEKLFEKLPTSYFEVEGFKDSRFTKVRIKIMHSGLNLNGSNFSQPAIDKAKETCKNIPILAFIKQIDGSDEKDFKGHEWELKITSDGLKYHYLGRPIGMIPESNNYSFEMDEDGKPFVFVDGYIWNDYANEALEILEQAGSKKVSMEILVDEYEYLDSYVDILEYRYTGIAILGDDVSEAMVGAKIDVVKFSQNAISSMMMELNSAIASFTAEKTEEETQETEFTEADEKDASENQEKTEENFESTESTESDVENETFEMGKTEESSDSSSSETSQTEENFSETQEENSKTEEADSTISMSGSEYEEKINSLTQELDGLKSEFQNLTEQYKALVATVEIREKEELSKIEKENKVALMSKFEDIRELEDFKKLEANLDTESLEMLELKLYAIRGKHLVEKDEKIDKVPVINLYSNEPEYIKLIRQNLQK